MRTKINTKSDEEKMLLTLGANLLEIGKKIFGKEIKIELQITEAPGSKVALIQECNPDTETTNQHYAKLGGDGFKILIADNALPF